uniref:diguanylate cyclase n=1 Tax=Magnetococcus massalia (strain MO-1) TaxID=451514 RepID=A0A1S7LGS0_MAGMO|nr:Putative response regulator receiver modulated diguanylate cyclase [Candidatus Magnetococcus massalia]
MSRILVVEHSPLFAKMVKHTLSKRIPMPFDFAHSLEETEAYLAEHGQDCFLALLDIKLPDAPNGEVVELVRGHDVPSVVFTGEYSDDLRERMMSLQVMDYVLKDSAASLDHLGDLIERLGRNRSFPILVVDDSSSARSYLCKLLESHRFKVLEAKNGRQAVEMLEQNPDVRLVLTDYHMPEMNGFELVQTLRNRYKRDILSIIGISAQGNNLISARFIKNGANDFLIKPFLEEEFFCRLYQNIESLELFQNLRDMVVRDFLTGLHNRRYLFETGHQLFSSFQRGQISLAAVMLDIDHFKKVNDTYGHDAGDEVLKAISQLLKEHVRETDVVARMGGEEFCMLMVNLDRKAVSDVLERLRASIEKTQVEVGEQTLQVTVSIGCSSKKVDSLDSLVSMADRALYHAKKSGRNRVVTG